MRTIRFEDIAEQTKRMCMEATHNLSGNMVKKFQSAQQAEVSPLGKEVLQQLIENARIAREEDYPICQDTGDAVFFVELGQDVRIEGGLISLVKRLGVSWTRKMVPIINVPTVMPLSWLSPRLMACVWLGAPFEMFWGGKALKNV